MFGVQDAYDILSGRAVGTCSVPTVSRELPQLSEILALTRLRLKRRAILVEDDIEEYLRV